MRSVKNTVSLLFLVVIFTVASTSGANTQNITQLSIETMKKNVVLAYTSYCPEAAIRKWDCYWCKQVGKLEITTTAYAKDKSVGGYVGHDSEFVYVIFRGTKATSLESWITNLRTSREKDWPAAFPGSHVHKGFVEGFLEIADAILEGVRKLAPQGKRIKILGHSRGGSLGLLAAVHLSLNGFSGKIDWMGFGAARTGNAVFHTHFNRLVQNAVRVVHQKDIVSRLPPTALGFRHVLREAWFKDGSSSYQMCSATDSEDKNCSKGVLIPSIPDHFGYLGYEMRDGKPYGCE